MLPPLTVRGNLVPMVRLDVVLVHWGNVVGPAAGTTGAGMGLVVHMPASDRHGLPAVVQVREPVLSTGDLVAGPVSRCSPTWRFLSAVLLSVVGSTLPSFAWCISLFQGCVPRPNLVLHRFRQVEFCVAPSCWRLRSGAHYLV